MTNYHLIQVSFLGPTNTLGPRVVLTSKRFEQRVVVPVKYTDVDLDETEIAANYLAKLGFVIIGRADGHIISETFEPINQPT